MTLLTITLQALVFVFFLAVGATGLFLYGQYRQNLAEFRKNLRVGHMAKAINPITGKTVRVRILMRASNNIYSVMDIDERTRFTTTIDGIFMP